MAYFAAGSCFCCGQIFTFNPHLVPAYAGEPVCRDCMGQINAQRARRKLPPHPILPGAYEIVAEATDVDA